MTVPVKGSCMFLAVSLLSALAGLGFAAAAAFLPDTGIDGTIGAFLALLGAVGVTLALAVLAATKPPAKARDLFTVIAALLAILTAVAAWFLMQNVVLAAMVLSLLALLASVATDKQKTII